MNRSYFQRLPLLRLLPALALVTLFGCAAAEPEDESASADRVTASDRAKDDQSDYVMKLLVTMKDGKANKENVSLSNLFDGTSPKMDLRLHGLKISLSRGTESTPVFSADISPVEENLADGCRLSEAIPTNGTRPRLVPKCEIQTKSIESVKVLFESVEKVGTDVAGDAPCNPKVKVCDEYGWWGGG